MVRVKGKIIKKRADISTRGFGTNFHSIYKKSPEIYDIFSLSEDVDSILFKEILKIQKKNSYRSLLDVACGTGVFLKKLNISKKFSQLYGLDLNKPLLEYARKRLPSSIPLLFANAENIPLLDNTIDFCITTWGSFSPKETYKEMERVTRHGGTILRVGTSNLDDLTRLFPSYSEKAVNENLKFLNSCGFKTKKFSIRIQFKSLIQAKNILSKITGCNRDDIKKRTLRHDVLFSWKKITNVSK